MSEHEKTITVHVPPERAFRYLSSVSNLPSFVPHVESVREDENDHIFGVANLDGRRYEMSGFFRADEANCRLDWESDGTPGYRGWLQIEPAGRDESRVTVHLSMRGAAAETPPPEPGLAGGRVERSLQAVMNSLRDTLEQKTAPTRSAV